MGKITQNRKNTWISNASNSFTYATKDALGELFPNIKQATESSKELVKAAKFDKGNKNIINEYEKTAKKSVKQALQDIKAGKIYNGDRADKEMMKSMMGGEDLMSDFEDMGFDDFDDDGNDSSSSSGGDDDKVFDDDTNDEVVREKTNNTNIISQKKTTLVKATIDTSELEEKITKYFATIGKVNGDGFKAVSSAIVDQTDKQSEFFNDTSDKLANIVNSVRNLEQSLVINTKENISQNATLNDVLVGNASLVDLFNNTSKNVNNQLDSPIAQMIVGGVLSDPVGMLTKSMMGKLIKGVDEKMLGGAAAKADKMLGQSKIRGLSFLDGLLNPETADKFQKQAVDQLGKLGPLGAFFGGKLGKIDISKYTNSSVFDFLRNQLDMSVGDGRVNTAAKIADPSQRVDFDAETHTTINKVLPGYLSKILSTITGKAEIYHDYRTGTWKTKEGLKKEYEEQRKNAALADNDANRNIIGDTFETKFKAKKDSSDERENDIDKLQKCYQDFLYYLAKNNIVDAESVRDLIAKDKAKLIKKYTSMVVRQVVYLLETDPITITSAINQIRANINDFDKGKNNNAASQITGSSRVAFSDIEDVVESINDDGEKVFESTTKSLAETSKKSEDKKTDTLSLLESMNKKMDKYDEMITLLVNIRDQQSNGKYFLGDPGKIYTHTIPTKSQKEQKEQDKEASDDNKRNFMQQQVDKLNKGYTKVKDKVVDKYNDMTGPKTEVFYPASMTAKEVAIEEAKRHGKNIKQGAENLFDDTKKKGEKLKESLDNKIDEKTDGKGIVGSLRENFGNGSEGLLGGMIAGVLGNGEDSAEAKTETFYPKGQEPKKEGFFNKVKSGFNNTMEKLDSQVDEDGNKLSKGKAVVSLVKDTAKKVTGPDQDGKTLKDKMIDKAAAVQEKLSSKDKGAEETAAEADKESVDEEKDPEKKASKGVLTSLFPGLATGLLATGSEESEDGKPKHKIISNLMDNSIIEGFRKLTAERSARNKARMDQAYQEEMEKNQEDDSNGDDEGSLFDDVMDLADDLGDSGEGGKSKSFKERWNGAKSIAKSKWGNLKNAYKHGGFKGAIKNLDRNTFKLGRRTRGLRKAVLAKGAGLKTAYQYGGIKGALKSINRNTLGKVASGVGLMDSAKALTSGGLKGMASGAGNLMKSAGGAITKGGLGALAKGAGKSFLKAVPFLGAAISGASAINNLKNGNIGDALLDGLSMIPGVGGIAANVAQMFGVGKMLNGVFGGVGKGIKKVAGGVGKVAKGAWNGAKKVGKFMWDWSPIGLTARVGKALWGKRKDIAKGVKTVGKKAVLLGPLAPAYLAAKGAKGLFDKGKAFLSKKKNQKKLKDDTVKAGKFLLGMTPLGMIANLGSKFKKKLADKGFRSNVLSSAENIAKVALMGTPFGWLFMPTASSLFNKLNKWVKDIKKGFSNLKKNIKNLSRSSSGGSGGSGGSSATQGNLTGDRMDFLKLPVGNDFGVDQDKMIQGAKKSQRVKTWLGGKDENIKKVADIVRKNGVSPELFFA